MNYFFHFIFTVLMFISYPLAGIFLQYEAKNDQSDVIFSYSDLNISIDMILISPHNLTRAITSHNSYGKDMQYFYPNSKYKIYTDAILKSPLRKQINNYIVETPHYFTQYSPPFKPTLIFIDILNDFVSKQNNRWLLRTTDDVVIDLFEMQKYIDHLEKNYDPLKHIVIKGQLVKKHYLHGGAGYFLSRAAAILLLEEFKKFPVRKVDYGDDVVLGKYCLMFLKPNDLKTSSFLSSPLKSESFRSFHENGTKHNYVSCEGKEIISRTDNIAAWHAGNKDLEVINNYHFVKKQLTPNYYTFLSTSGQVEFCVDQRSDLMLDYIHEDINTTRLTLEDARKLLETKKMKN